MTGDYSSLFYINTLYNFTIGHWYVQKFSRKIWLFRVLAYKPGNPKTRVSGFDDRQNPETRVWKKRSGFAFPRHNIKPNWIITKLNLKIRFLCVIIRQTRDCARCRLVNIVVSCQSTKRWDINSMLPTYLRPDDYCVSTLKAGIVVGRG